MAPRAHPTAWAVLPVFGVLLAFAPATAGLRTLSSWDTDLLYRPARRLVVEALLDLRLPLWNPYEGTGKPLFAEGIHSVLHPISLLAALVAPWSIDFLILAYLVAAATGAAWLARALDASPPAAAGAGLAYALSGYSVSMTGNLVFLAGLSTLPWVVAAARIAGLGQRWGFVATAASVACAVLSGDVQATAVGIALGAVLAVDAGGLRGIARASGGTAVGLLVGAVQLLATSAQLETTHRGVPLLDWERTAWALPPARMLEWVIPGLFRGPLADVPWDRFGAGVGWVFAGSVYLGAPALVAAALSRSSGAPHHRRTTLTLLTSAALLLWLAFGHHLGARQSMEWIPVWNRLRYSEKHMAGVSLCIAALAATGLDTLAAKPLTQGWRRALAALALASAALYVLMRTLAPSTEGLAGTLLGASGSFYHANLRTGLPHLFLALAGLLGLDRLPAGRARAHALSLLVALSPALAVLHGAHLGSHDLRAPSPLPLGPMASGPPRIVHLRTPAYPRHVPTDFLEWRAMNSAMLLDPAVNTASHVDAIQPYGAFEPRRLGALAARYGVAWGLSFRRFAVTHIVLPVPGEDPNPSATALALDGGALVQRRGAPGYELWAVPHRPWAFFPRRAAAVPGPGEALDAVVALTGMGADDAVIVEAAASPPTAPGQILNLERRDGSLRVVAESLEPSLLVIQDAFWPGWRASIDGEPTEILAGDFLVRAVRWPPGRHVLEMNYDPPEVRLGLALSLIGVVALLVAAAVAWVRRAPPSASR